MKVYVPEERCNICGKKLKEVRKSLALSQEELAAKLQLAGCNITQKAISRMENGKQVVTDYEVKYLAEALEITVYELLGIEE